MFLLLTLSKQSWEGGSLAKGAVPKKNMALGNRFQKMRGSLTIRAGGGGEVVGGWLNSHRGRGELNFQRRLQPRGLPCFSANALFLWEHCY